MSTGVWVLVVAIVGALAFGCYRALTDGRFRGSRQLRARQEEPVLDVPIARSLLANTPWADELGERGTLLQFSSAFCAPCRATRRILQHVASTAPDIAHIEVDAEQHLDLVRRLGILRTPTTIVLDPQGGEVTRATGAPTKHQVLAALGRPFPTGPD